MILDSEAGGRHCGQMGLGVAVSCRNPEKLKQHHYMKLLSICFLSNFCKNVIKKKNRFICFALFLIRAKSNADTDKDKKQIGKLGQNGSPRPPNVGLPQQARSFMGSFTEGLLETCGICLQSPLRGPLRGVCLVCGGARRHRKNYSNNYDDFWATYIII